ncbi:sugar diacid recognition domain-containing protein [Oceanobacillus sp. AG]|uniref:CdaR family transcriptional regulator n=1 Tax=Oceanobacillus sp. AG TaxID=2681969 RepID=UPI0012EBE2DD|nr:sugar diacid recognition domain-containing protein [Oceanobacillus sp. AG]
MNRIFHSGQFYSSIVQEIRDLINEDVILTNQEGIIVASTDNARINNFHEGAFIAMKSKKNMEMTEALAAQLEGVRKGVVLPLILDEKPLGVIGITGEPEIVRPYAMLVQKVAELFMQDSIIQTDRERQARELEFFVFDWLNSKEITKSLIERSNFLGINIKKYNRVAILRGDQSALSFTYKDINLLKVAWDYEGDTLFIRWGQNKILMLLTKQHDNEKLRRKLSIFLKEVQSSMKMQMYVGVGEITTYNNMFSSFEQAAQASDVSSRDQPIVFEENLKFDMLQQALDEGIKRKFVERTILSLLDDPVLLETLSHWFENNMSNKNTAEKLHIHKNTLLYRLKRVEELLGIQLNKTHDLLTLYMGYLFLKEVGEEGAPA